MDENCTGRVELGGKIELHCEGHGHHGGCCNHYQTKEYVIEGAGSDIVQDLLANKEAALQSEPGWEVADWHLDQLSSEGCDKWLQVIVLTRCLPCERVPDPSSEPCD